MRSDFGCSRSGRVALGFGLWLAYSANGREIGAGDTIAALLQPIAIARGDGLVLDRFDAVLHEIDPAADRFPPYYVASKEGRLLSRYPVTPVLITLPLVLPQIAFLDARRPEWDADPTSLLWYARRIGKNASAAVAAVTAMLLLEVLVRLQLGRVALAATIVAALGSPLWTIAAQSPWHHGPSALALTAALLLLLGTRRPATLVGAGAALAVLVACRFTAALVALPLVLGVLWRRPGDGAWLLPPFAVVGALVVGYNVREFGSAFGGQSEIEAVSLGMHALRGSWGDLGAGAAGTLVSPSRGLLVFCPWVAVAVLVLAVTRARFADRPIVPALVVGLVAHGLLFAKYSAWWAGWCFGPRYWTEVVPLLGILLALALEAARTGAPWARRSLYGAGMLAIGIHAVGAICYPSSWNATPPSVDVRHERLWDWRDSEITRALREGPRPRQFPIAPW